eukprot:CAMPEP_0194504624 /NCGR_PEP_ID=MMETSP0253-20130528/29053_1 /TAXON_ID=2966 /ORGANISM="Noctiluca scintillans" /LENGTH=270 /DNA_ID=CAMNT_0039347041 /DNA_START=34 /DNA_END=842 /DNA_ORIENTATION=+
MTVCRGKFESDERCSNSMDVGMPERSHRGCVVEIGEHVPKSVMEHCGGTDKVVDVVLEPVCEVVVSKTALIPDSSSLVFLESDNGQVLVHVMNRRGRDSHRRWCRCWEAQVTSGSCAAATAVMALRFLDFRNMSQQRILDEVVHRHRLVTAGVSLSNGMKMFQLIFGNQFHVEERCMSDEAEMEQALRSDLVLAFEEGLELCILANYLRPGGGGHWSPLGGFVQDWVLVMDTNAWKSPPHWMQITTFVKSLCAYNDATRRARGYVVLWRA